ncbi:MAG: PilZ domain-containing protein [Acidobacteriota bacterium]|jgi:hypothetical protein
MEQKNVVNRRKAPRFDASAIPSLKSVHIAGGPGMKLINISRRGALIETQKQMSLGSRVSLRIVTEEAVYPIKGRILRCNVHSIDKVLAYLCAITFDEDFTNLPLDQEAD